MKYAVDDTRAMPALTTLSRWLGVIEPTGNGKLPAAEIPSRKEKKS